MTCVVPTTYVSSGTSSLVTDKNYNSFWQPSSLPATISFDVSTLVSGGMTNCLVTWYNDATYNFNENIQGTSPTYGLPGTYTIQTNTAPGGSLPTANWYTLYTTTGNYFNGLQHIVTLASSGGNVNWVRISFTAMAGSDAQTVPSIKVNLYDATYGSSDGWFFGGDSITANAMGHTPTGSADAFDNMAHAFGGNYAAAGAYPWSVKAGMAGWEASNLLTGAPLTLWEQWMQTFSGRYVGISMGANDAGTGSIAVPPATFSANMLRLAQISSSYGKVVIIPTITYSPDSARNPNVITQNNAITSMIASNSWIIRGPDLYTIFSPSATSGIASTTGTLTTLTDSTKNWVPGGYVGMVIHNTSKSVSATVTSNTATTMTFTGGMTAASLGDSYYLDGSVLINSTDNLHPTAQGNAILRTHWAYFAANLAQTYVGNISNIQTGNSWAGMQDLVNAVRSTGSTNVCLISGVGYSNDLSGLLANIPTDTLGQMGVAWHPYPPLFNVNGVSIVSGGSGWSGTDIGKTITMPLGTSQGGTYDGLSQQSIFTITSVSGGAVTGLSIATAGVATGPNFWASPVPMVSTTGAGTGVTVNLTLGGGYSSPGSYSQRPTALTINNTYPLVVTESGDWSTAGMTTSLYETDLSNWADTNGIGIIWWAWDAFGQWQLITGTSSNPTGVAPGYGTAAYNWMTNHA
jgi:lysophospholipase L1-like esterase